MARRSAPRPALPAQLAADVWQHLRNRRPLVTAEQLAQVRAKAIRVTNADADTTRIDLMAEIGYWGVTAQDFVDEILAISSKNIELHVNSPGGDVFDGVAIMNAIADHPATVNVIVDGIAASAASFLAMAGDTVKMNRGSQMMIHDASGFCYGNAADMADTQALLDRISDLIAGIYAERAGGTVEAWRALMQAETWYSASEAVTAGLADEAVGAAAAPDEGDDEGDEGDEEETGDDEPVEPADLFREAYARFEYAGRAQAPAPPTPGRRPEAFQFDPDAFRAAFKEGITS